MARRHFDAVILGGGASGSAAALTLLQQGGSVAIVERSDFSEPRVGETIPPDTNLLLQELGVTDAFRAQGHLPCYGSSSLWGSARLGHNDFLVNVHGHGWHLNRARFDAMLLAQAEQAGAQVFQEDCRTVNVDGTQVTAVCLSSGDLTGDIYLDASGRNAVLTRSLGIGKDFNDRQVVIWARFTLGNASAFGHSTWLEAASNGWWYGARLPGDEVIIAFGTDPHVAKSLDVYDLKNWLFQLTETELLAPRLTQARLIPDSFRITASQSYCTRQVVGENWIAIGDAATAFDPLSSAGIYKALMTGQLAAQVIAGQMTRDAYQNRIREDYTAYLQMRTGLYDAEQRWPDQPFWRSRIKTPAHA